MKISKDKIKEIAKLARLEVSEEKMDLFSKQLSQILEYMELLAEVDTSNVEPLYSPMEHSTPYREDKVVCNYSRDEVLSNAPLDDGEYFIVPKVVS